MSVKVGRSIRYMVTTTEIYMTSEHLKEALGIVGEIDSIGFHHGRTPHDRRSCEDGAGDVWLFQITKKSSVRFLKGSRSVDAPNNENPSKDDKEENENE